MEVEAEFRKQVREFLFPPIDKNLLTRQIYELVHYGHFTYESIISMPISRRRRMYYLLVKYSERDQAVSKGQSPPPIDVEEAKEVYGASDNYDPQEKIDRLISNVKKREKTGYKRDLKEEEEKLPSAVREALNRLKSDGLVNELDELVSNEVVEQKEKLAPPKKKIEIPKAMQDLLSKVQRID